MVSFILREFLKTRSILRQKNVFALSVRCRTTFNTVSSDLDAERQFLIRAKHDCDNFGNPTEEPQDCKSDGEDHRREQPLSSQRLTTKQYADQAKSFIRQGKLQEAIDVLEIRMLKHDKVKPEAYMFNLILSACSRVGYTKKAFSLYNEMKRRGLKASGCTYTALFNACANSPWQADGLQRANALKQIMSEKMYEPNVSNYNAMIKAFGRCGDLTTTFNLVDEMSEKNISIKDDTINFLLQACIQDKEAGFRHALLVWRKAIEKKIQPSVYTYNLMLRCIRDCQMGDLQITEQTLKALIHNKLPVQDLRHEAINDGDLKMLPQEINDDFKMLPQLQMRVTESSDDERLRSNLMATNPYFGTLIPLSQVIKAEDRLLLVGGLRGFLENMDNHNVIPNLKTFTLLLDCIPGSLALEKELRKIMNSRNIKPDIDFFNMLIKKRSMNFEYEAAKEVFMEMMQLNYRPNLMTYGILALGCKTKENALELINDMKTHSYRLNTEILGTMLHQACHNINFPYVLEIMNISKKEKVNPNEKFMKCLDNFKKKCKEICNDQGNRRSHSASFRKGFSIFKMSYKSWLQEIEVDNSSKIHPWAQYRRQSNTDMESHVLN